MPSAIVEKRSRLLPPWILRLLGFSSLAATIVALAVYWFKRFPPSARGRRASQSERLGSNSGLRRTSSNLSEKTAMQQRPAEVSTAPRQVPNHEGWGSRLLGNVMSAAGSSRKTRKKMTISLKNTVLWNPSSDVESPNHAFQENATALLGQLTQLYDIYLIVHMTSEDERAQINDLLANAGLTEKGCIDRRKILYCSTEEGKIHMIRHIEPQTHVEGGWELDDGEDIVRKLRPFVSKLVWVITRRRRSSFNQAKLKESDQGILGANVELTEKLLDTSIAREVGFFVRDE